MEEKMKKVVTFLLTAAAVLAVGLAGCNNQGDDGTGDDNGLVERFVYVAGEFESVGGKPRTGLARVDSNGYTDMSFNAALKDESDYSAYVYAVEVDDTGNVYIAGDFVTVNGASQEAIAKLSSDGYLDRTFAPVIKEGEDPGEIYSLQWEPGGTLLIAGSFETINDAPANDVARIDASTGTLTEALDIVAKYNDGNQTIDGGIYSAYCLDDDSLVIGGHFTSINDAPASDLARILPTGQIDSNFIITPTYPPACPEERKVISGLLEEPSGTLLVCGPFSELNGVQNNTLGRITTAGIVEPKLEVYLDPSGCVLDIENFDDASVVITGPFTSVNGKSRTCIAKIDRSTGNLYEDFVVHSDADMIWGAAVWEK
jgi:hypothetical protein